MGNGEKTRPKGWFSRRHQTSDARDAAVAKWRAAHGPEARRRRAQERHEAVMRAKVAQIVEEDHAILERLGS